MKDDSTLCEAMALVREVCSLGLNARQSVNIKVRQPLGTCTVILKNERQKLLLAQPWALDIIKDELSVKDVVFLLT